jgi:uncharacterized glyoxalase superfamily protein PhnB
MPTQIQGVIPMIAYENGTAAMDWLQVAFGFTERIRMTTPGGMLSHGEMETGNGIIMLASPTPDYESPSHHRKHCEQAAKWSAVPYIIDGALVHVNDINAHYERAKNAGAVILSEPEDTPHGRIYRCEDIEGHRWMFSEDK